MKTEYNFSINELEKQIPQLKKLGITELSVHDEELSADKNKVMQLIRLISQYAPEVFVNFYVDASIIDKTLLNAASEIFCSFDIPLNPSHKGGKLLFDKKFYAGKARLLNDFGLVFGFQLSYAQEQCDSLKAFLDRLDFALNQYPNHIEFPQIENVENQQTAKVSGSFSAKDIRYARDVAFACSVFYTGGRAVPWMLSVLKPLRIYPSRFFSDFAEWQMCNNCDFKSGFSVHSVSHKEIEKMQLLFISEKYEEKSCSDLLTAVEDIIKLNGSMSRLCGEGIEETIELSYNPDDLLGPEAFDIISFTENVCMEHCCVKLFPGEDGPDYSII